MTPERQLYLAISRLLVEKGADASKAGVILYVLDDSPEAEVSIPLKVGEVLSLPVILLRDAP
jgi:hypothetical protein